MRCPLFVSNIFAAALGYILTKPYWDMAFPISVFKRTDMAPRMKPFMFALASYDSQSGSPSYMVLVVWARKILMLTSFPSVVPRGIWGCSSLSNLDHNSCWYHIHLYLNPCLPNIDHTTLWMGPLDRRPPHELCARFSPKRTYCWTQLLVDRMPVDFPNLGRAFLVGLFFHAPILHDKRNRIDILELVFVWWIMHFVRWKHALHNGLFPIKLLFQDSNCDQLIIWVPFGLYLTVNNSRQRGPPQDTMYPSPRSSFAMLLETLLNLITSSQFRNSPFALIFTMIGLRLFPASASIWKHFMK